MRPKFLDAAARDAAAARALEAALHAAREEQQADSLWVSEHGKSFALGFFSCLMLEILLFLIWYGTTR